MNDAHLKKIVAKDIEFLLGVSLSSAERYYNDVKKEFNLKIVTRYHLNLYLKIPISV